jgi:hypothetical protein
MLFTIIEFASPMKEADQLALFLPDKADKVPGTDGLGLAPGVGLDAPAKIVAAPWPQAVSARGIPKKPHRTSHCRRTPATV